MTATVWAALSASTPATLAFVPSSIHRHAATKISTRLYVQMSAPESSGGGGGKGGGGKGSGSGDVSGGGKPGDGGGQGNAGR